MPQIVTIGNTLMRVNTQKNMLEVSVTGGRTWNPRFRSTSHGTLRDLLYYKGSVDMCCDRGVFVSSTEGKTFNPRYTGSGCGQFLNLQDNGREIIATTSNGLYRSENEGSSIVSPSNFYKMCPDMAHLNTIFATKLPSIWKQKGYKRSSALRLSRR